MKSNTEVFSGLCNNCTKLCKPHTWYLHTPWTSLPHMKTFILQWDYLEWNHKTKPPSWFPFPPAISLLDLPLSHDPLSTGSDLDGLKWHVDISPQRAGSVQILPPVHHRWTSISLQSLVNRTTAARISSRSPTWLTVGAVFGVIALMGCSPFLFQRVVIWPNRGQLQSEVQQLLWMPVSHPHWQSWPDYFN